MKNKTIPIIILSLFFISFISAITIYAGESVTLELEKPYTYYSIVGNSTEVDIEVTQEGKNVTIIPSKYSLNDSYEIVFFNSAKEVIIVYEPSGGGGGEQQQNGKQNMLIKKSQSMLIKKSLKKLLKKFQEQKLKLKK